MNHPVWQVILGLSRYPVFFTTEHTEHTETNSPTVLSCFRVFGVFRGFLLFGDKIEDVIAQQICLLVTEDDFAKSGGIGEGDGRGVSGWRRAALPDSMSDALLPSQTALQDFYIQSRFVLQQNLVQGRALGSKLGTKGANNDRRS
jgi:hypothetical protein